jgi:predicted methyltransferase
MRISTLFVLATLWLAGTAVAAPLEQILESPHRDADSSRDDDRHPAETLAFFQVEPDMTVVEVWPGGGGWYTAILAPWLRDHGTLYAAQFPADSGVDFYQRALQRYQEKLAAPPGALRPGENHPSGPAGAHRHRTGRQRRPGAHLPQRAQLGQGRHRRGRL